MRKLPLKWLVAQGEGKMKRWGMNLSHRTIELFRLEKTFGKDWLGKIVQSNC